MKSPVGERVCGNPGEMMFIKFAIYDLAACVDCIPDESDTCREDHQRGYDGSIDQGRWRKVKLRTGSVTDSYHSLFSKKTFRHASRPVQIVCSVSFRLSLCAMEHRRNRCGEWLVKRLAGALNGCDTIGLTVPVVRN